MPKLPITADTLMHLGDGYAKKAVQKALDDLVDRGHDGKPRKLVITYTFKPSDEGTRLKANVDVQTKMPAYAPPETAAKFDRAAGGFMFNPDSPGNPDQQTFDDAGLPNGDAK